MSENLQRAAMRRRRQLGSSSGRLSLSRFTVGITTVAFSLSRRLIPDHPRYPGVLGCDAGFVCALSYRVRGGLLLAGFRIPPFLLCELEPVALLAPLFPGGSGSEALSLSCRSQRLGCSPCSAIGIEKSCLGIRRCGAPI